MGDKINCKKNKKISLIIPAKNESKNISRVLKIAVKAKEIDEIIVIADDCNDNTVEIAKKFKVKVFENINSKGKGDAMIRGVGLSTGEIIMFMDADLVGLKQKHINQLLLPIINQECDITIGLRGRIFGLSALIPKIFHSLAIGGERAMSKDFFNSLPVKADINGFGIETIINWWAKKNKLRMHFPILEGLNQVIKEKKWGFFKGFYCRIILCYQIIKAQIKIRL